MLDSLFEAAMPIASHSLATMAAVTLGGTQLFTAKGTTRHRGLGWAWVGLVTYVTTSSFFISGLKRRGAFSWIHY